MARDEEQIAPVNSGDGDSVEALIGRRDWSDSPIGSPDQWPQSLKTAVGLILPAKAQITLFWGPEFVALYNDAYAPTIGDKHPRALGRPARENWAELWDDLRPLLQGVRDTGETCFAKDRPFYIERHGYPETVYFDISYSAVPDESGGVGGVLCIVSETTQRVLSERRNAADRERLERMFEQAPGIMAMLVGPDHVFELANPAYLHLVGNRDIIGLPLREALPEVEGQGFGDILDEVYRTGKAFVGAGVNVDLQRSPSAPLQRHVIDFVYQPVIDAEGQVSGIFVQGMDVTERTAAERDLRELNDALESRVVEEIERRSATEEILRQAQKMETVGQLSGGIAHDFNNLLQVIQGNLSLLDQSLANGTERQKRWLTNAWTGTERAAALTQRLLAFSRRQPIAAKTIDVNRMISGMADLLHRTLGETVDLRTALQDGVWLTKVDPNQLENAILNLAINARDAMDGSGRLTVETRNATLDEGYAARNPDAAPGDYVLIEVSDEGPGMDQATLTRAIEPFFTTKEVGKGTGLGLAMVYGFAQQSGGHFRLYSEPGHGTTAKIYLPRGRTGQIDAREERKQSAEPGSGETILLCEDDADVRRLSIEMLRELGYNVIEASNAAETLSNLREAPRVDLLFTDVVLPGGMTGSDLAAAARAVRPELKVLYTTGYARTALDHQGKIEAEAEMLLKPFTVTALAAKIRQVLES